MAINPEWNKAPRLRARALDNGSCSVVLHEIAIGASGNLQVHGRGWNSQLPSPIDHSSAPNDGELEPF